MSVEGGRGNGVGLVLGVLGVLGGGGLGGGGDEKGRSKLLSGSAANSRAKRPAAGNVTKPCDAIHFAQLCRLILSQIHQTD